MGFKTNDTLRRLASINATQNSVVFVKKIVDSPIGEVRQSFCFLQLLARNDNGN